MNDKAVGEFAPVDALAGLGPLLVANRGEIACRVLDSAHRLGLPTVAVYSEADVDAAHVRAADAAEAIGPAPARQSYLDVAAVLEAARRSGARSVHPGYGFLSEDPTFATAVQAAGLVWIGPSPEAIAIAGDKLAARDLALALGIPVLAGGGEQAGSVDQARDVAAAVGYPVMVKAAAGGGGVGMQVAWDDDGLTRVFDAAVGAGQRLGGTPSVLLERYVPAARHVEVQLLGLADGRVVAVGDRDCSVQRRYQKIVEEAPAPALADEVRPAIRATAERIGRRLEYRGAGTVEFLVSGSDFWFLELNPRLQVEHPVTELVTGLDLVAEQLRAAAGLRPDWDEPPEQRGHAIEARVYAEDPVRFLPSPGTITRWRLPDGEGIRSDTGLREGDAVTPHYDPLIAKICAWGPDRPAAIARLARALEQLEIEGPKTNVAFLRRVLEAEEFTSATHDTGVVPRLMAD